MTSDDLAVFEDAALRHGVDLGDELRGRLARLASDIRFRHRGDAERAARREQALKYGPSHGWDNAHA